MKKFEIDCFEVTQPDGGGMHSDHVAYASTKHVAELLAKQNSGWPGYVHEYKKTFLILDSVEEYKDLVQENKRQKALAKLTDEDKKVLGL